MPDTANSEAYVTLVTNDRYALGALVLSQSLRNVGATRQLVVMFTPGVSQEMRDQLLYAFDVMVQVDVLDSQDAVNLDLLTRPDLGVTFTKLHCWRLTQFTKCVFMDADTMVLQNTDELFEREEFSAAPDVGWPDCFNSGVFVFRPSEETYSALLHLALTQGSFDGGDQGLLNSYFSDWSTKDIKRHLPFVYNIVAHAFYSYLPALKQFGQSIKVVHFIGSVKPWSLGYNTATGQVEGNSSHAAEFVNKWWKVFMEKIHYRLDGSLTSLVNVFERHPPLPPPPSCEAPVWTPPPPPPVYETHQMMTPYVPPEVPVFYDPTPQPHISEVPEMVVVPESRPFYHFESFYTEPSMAQVESHPFVGEMYHAKEFSDVMTEYTHPPEPPPAPSQQVEHAADISADAATAVEVSAEAETWTVVADIQEPPVDEKPAVSTIHSEEASHLVTSKSGVGESDAVTGAGATSGARTRVTKKDDQSLGAVEVSVEVTSLEESSNLKMYTKQQLSDRERQFNWERGQIDYLGIDSFENILRQIEGTIKEPLVMETPPSLVTDPSPPAHSSAPSVPLETSASGPSLDDVATVESTDRGVGSEE